MSDRSFSFFSSPISWWHSKDRFWNKNLSMEQFMLVIAGIAVCTWAAGSAFAYLSATQKQKLIARVRQGDTEAIAEALQRVKFF